MKGDVCLKCGKGKMKKEYLPEGFWLECQNCGYIPDHE